LRALQVVSFISLRGASIEFELTRLITTVNEIHMNLLIGSIEPLDHLSRGKASHGMNPAPLEFAEDSHRRAPREEAPHKLDQSKSGGLTQCQTSNIQLNVLEVAPATEIDICEP
jgi:hypothetical protein